MYRNFLPQLVLKVLVLGITFLSLAQVSAAQFEPASPPIANPADTRFKSVHEDWTTPALNTSTLKPALPLLAGPGDYPTYTVELNQVQWRFGDPLDLYVIKPKGVKNPPVIIYLYSYNYDTDIFKSEAWQRAVTKDGFAAVGFCTALTGHRYHDRPMRQWFVSELQESLADSAHDVQMVLNYLATRNDLDMNRVGIFAEGSGASIAILASAVDPRIKVVDAVAPWGDWPTWMADSPFVPKNERADYVKPDYLKKVSVLDPVDWLPKIQAKKFRFQDATFDPTTPKASKEKLRAAVPSRASVVIYNTAEELNAARDHNKMMDWLREGLRSLPDGPANTTAATLNKP
jgi:dienelactone hydrolase